MQLPRADIKPYHESYFADNPSTSLGHQRPTTTTSVQSSQSSASNGDMPLEGLAATLHARMIGNHNVNNSNNKADHSSSSRRYLKVLYNSFLK